ncbi:hypothetical protein [Dielma fastidiosa]|uniref:hypothetical protein n=1 Tax=Dielma fastidiosa TaxID=1034346 RepID=UPI0002DEB635|nr:hypothetical protein [Dielma fastidiosa]
MSFFEILDLHLDEFLLFQRDAFIYDMEKSEQGKEYLSNAKRLETESTDYDAFEKVMNGGG